MINFFLYVKAKNTFLKLLDDTESWLYSDEAENQEKSVYVDRLTKLKVLILLVIFFFCICHTI